MPEIAELAEQHPELRLRSIDSQDIHAHNGVTWSEEPGAYEWWEISTLDATGSGMLCSMHIGHAFNPTYRRHVRQLRSGRFVDPARGRKSSTAAIRVAIFQRGRLAARSAVSIDPRQFSETPPAHGWSVQFGASRLWADGAGWRLHLDLPRTPTGWRRVAHPLTLAPGRIIADLTVQPHFHTPTFFRQFLPDSPSGASHDWLPACPCGSVTGLIKWSNLGDDQATLDLSDADGSVDHFRGAGPIGEGLRRVYIARVGWPGGAAIGQLIIIRKYIQLAPTLMIFADGESPRIIRGDRTRRADFQRSAWLLGYPMSLGWVSEREGVTVEHAIDRLADASPCRTTSISRCNVRLEGASHEVKFEDRRGLVQLIQPPRIEAWPWRWWCESAVDPGESGRQ